jgi:hypothetical protein
VFLQQNDTGANCEILDAADLALTESCLPVFAPDHDLDDLSTVQPVFNPAVVDDVSGVIETPSGLRIFCSLSGA